MIGWRAVLMGRDSVIMPMPFTDTKRCVLCSYGGRLVMYRAVAQQANHRLRSRNRSRHEKYDADRSAKRTHGHW